MRTLILVLLLPALTFNAGCGSAAGEVPDDAESSVVFAAAEASREAGDLDTAEDLYERVYEDYPKSPERIEAGWLEAEMMFAQGDYKAAKTAFQEFYEKHRMYRLGELENRLYVIGDSLFEDGQSGLLGLGVFPTSALGIGTMQWIVDNLPKGSRADDALMFMARANMDLREYLEATIQLEMILEHYQQREWVFEARYLLGEALLAENRGADYDLLVLRQSKAIFQRYIEIIENDEVRRTEYAERVERAKERVVEIDRRLSDKNLKIAEYYISVQRDESAKFYLETAIRMYPDTDAAVDAGKKLEEIRTRSESE